jgi:glycosyltransferase involved in cell wall biosynthesis
MNFKKQVKILVYFIPFTREPGEDTISTRIPLLYSILKDNLVELYKAPQIPNIGNFALTRFFLLITSGTLILQLLPRIKQYFHHVIVVGSDQPSGFVASILGRLLKIFGKLGNKDVLIVYDSHGSRYKLAQDLSPPLPYKMVSIFEDAYSVKAADIVLIPTFADHIIYSSYISKKSKFMILPSFVKTDRVVYREWGQRTINFAFHANFKYRPNVDALRIISQWLSTVKNIHDIRIIIFGINSFIAYKLLPSELFERNNIKIFGYISNPFYILGNTQFYLAPIFKGTGIITKVLEAMAAGCIPITTKFVSLGIPELKQWPELVANSPEDWIYKLNNHLSKAYEMNYDAISKRLSDIVKHKYSYETNKQNLKRKLFLLLRNAKKVNYERIYLYLNLHLDLNGNV